MDKTSIQHQYSQEVVDLIDRKIEINKEVFKNSVLCYSVVLWELYRCQNILNAFKVSFPDWETELSFETPNYKVRVGRFKNLNIANRRS